MPDKLRKLARMGAEVTLNRLRAEIIAIERTFPELALPKRRRALRRKVKQAILGHLYPASHLASIGSLLRDANADAVVSKARLSFGSFTVRPNQRYPPKSPPSLR